MSEPVIGGWWTVCCIEDLYPIRNEEELAEVVDWIADEEDGVPAHVWPDLASALADPFIAPMVKDGTYSPQTAARLGLPGGRTL